MLILTFIRKTVVLLLAVIVGFWLAASGVLEGTVVGEWLNTVVSYVPVPNEFSEQHSPGSEIVTEPLEPIEDSGSAEEASPSETSSSEVNYQRVEESILNQLNTLRQDQGLTVLRKNDMLKKAADIRARETEELFSHTRPDGTDAFSIFKEDGIVYPYQIVGENLGMATYYLNEEGMAELLFNGWVESEGHYENMIRPEFEEIGIGVHYDGEFLYATQIFGTPR